jgi:hypothetical protein
MAEDRKQRRETEIQEFEGMLDFMANKWESFFSGLFQIQARSNNRLVQGFANLANAWISEVERMIAKWIAFSIIKAIGGNPLSFLIPNTGGVKTAQTGADFTTPANAVGETVPVFAGANERVRVQPASTHRQESRMQARMLATLQSMNMNVVDLAMRQTKIEAQVSIKNRELQQMIQVENREETFIR